MDEFQKRIILNIVDFFVENYPFFESHPPETPILRITPPPELHLMIGIFNHILKGMEDIYEYHKNACHEYALKHN